MNYIDKMMDIIKKQFIAIMNDDPDFYSRYDIILSNEQQYIKNEDRNPKSIYIVVKFVPGSINYEQMLFPINFNVLGEGNKLDVAQRLLLDYAQTYNLGEEEKWNEGTDSYVAKQVYTQPQVMSNFNTFSNEFRSLFYMTGTFLIGKNSIPITLVEYFKEMPSVTPATGETIDFITTAWDFAIQLDSQAFYGTDSITKSKSKIGTLTFSMTIYATNSDLCKKIRGIAFQNATDAPNGIKESFYFRLTFADGTETDILEFHLAHVTSPQSIGEFPMMNAIFTL